MGIKTKLFWAVLLLAFLAGCQTLAERQADKSLQSALKSFEANVRWGNLPKLRGFLKPELAREAKLQPGLENIRVTGYDVVEGPMRISPTQARQVALIRYVWVDRQVVRELLDEQIWEREDEEAAEWVRVSPLPVFH